MDERFGLLLDHNRLALLLDSVQYRALQLGQEIKATGKDDSVKRHYLRSLVDMRDELNQAAMSMAGHIPAGAVIVEGEKS